MRARPSPTLTDHVRGCVFGSLQSKIMIIGNRARRVDQPNDFGETPLLSAIYSSYFEGAEFLVRISLSFSTFRRIITWFAPCSDRTRSQQRADRTQWHRCFQESIGLKHVRWHEQCVRIMSYCWRELVGSARHSPDGIESLRSTMARGSTWLATCGRMLATGSATITSALRRWTLQIRSRPSRCTDACLGA